MPTPSAMYDRPHSNSNSNPTRGDLDDGHNGDLPLPSRGGRRSRGGGAIAGDNEILDRHGYGATYGGSGRGGGGGGGGGSGPHARNHHAMNPDAVNNENYDKNTTTHFDALGGTNNGYGNSRGGGYAGHPHAYHPYHRSSMTGGMMHPHRGSLDLSVGGMSAMGGMNMNMNMNANMNMGGGGPMAGPGAGGGGGPMGMGTNTTMAGGGGGGGWGPNGGAGGGGPSNASYGYAGMGQPAHGGPRPMNHRGSMGSLSGWGPMGGGGYPPSPGFDANAAPGNRENVDGNAGRADREEGNDDARRSGIPRHLSEERGRGGGGNFGNEYRAYGGPTPRGMHGPDPRMAHQRNGAGPSARGPPPDEYPDEPEGIDYLAARAHAAQMLAAEESKRLEENLMRLEMRKMMMDRYPVGSARANAADDGSTSPPAPRDIPGAKEGRSTPNGVMRPPLHETKGGASSSSYGYANSAHHNAGDDFLMARAQTHLEGQRSAVKKSSAPSPAAGAGRYGNRSTVAGKHRDMDDGPDVPQDERNSRRGYNPNDRNDKTPSDDIMYNRKGGRNNGDSNNADYFSQGHNHMNNGNNYPLPPHHPHQFHPSSNYPQFHRMSMSMMNAPGNMMMMNPNHPYPPMDAMHPYHPNAYPPPPMDDEHLAMRHGHLLGTAGFGNHPPAAPPHRHPQSQRGRAAPSKSDDKSQVAADGAAVEAPPREVIVKPVKELSAPRRPLSAYNIFFSEMREIILKEHEGDDGNTDTDKIGDGEDHDKGDGDDARKDSASATSSPDKKPESVIKKEGQEDGDEGDADMKDSSPDATKSSSKDDTNNDDTNKRNTTDGGNEANNIDNDNKTPTSQKEKSDNDSSTPTLTPEGNMEAFTQKLMKKRLDKSAGKRLHRRTHGKVAFTTLAQTVGKRWRELPEEKKKKYRELAEMDRARYRKEKQARGKALREEAKRQRKEAAARAAAAAAASH